MTPDSPSYRTIPLTKGLYAIVDASDYEWLSQWKWCAAHTGPDRFYAARGETRNGKQRFILMHREILGLKSKSGLECDHINRNGLDNRRENIRAVTRKENCTNRRERRRSKWKECDFLESILPAGSSVNFWHGKWIVKTNSVFDSYSEVLSLAKKLSLM